MGLFGFLKNVGSKILNKDSEAQDIKKHIEANIDSSSINNLDVKFDNGTAILSGECPDQAVQEKVILLAGNVEGVENINSEALVLAEGAPTAEVKFYTIKSGDTLSGIAKEVYGDPMKYPVIFENNREVIKDPDLIYPGQQIRIPAL